MPGGVHDPDRDWHAGLRARAGQLGIVVPPPASRRGVTDKLCDYQLLTNRASSCPSRASSAARAAYARSFLYTETDDNDFTYFLLHQLRVLVRGIEDLHDYLRRKSAELRGAADLVRRSARLRAELNARQLALVSHALRHEDAVYTLESHRVPHGVSYQIARSGANDFHDRTPLANGFHRLRTIFTASGRSRTFSHAGRLPSCGAPFRRRSFA